MGVAAGGAAAASLGVGTAPLLRPSSSAWPSAGEQVTREANEKPG